MKNMDPLNENVVSLLQSSSDAFVCAIWKDGKLQKNVPDITIDSSGLTLVMLNKLRCHTHFKFSASQIDPVCSHTEWQTLHIQISWLLKKPTDLDLLYLQRQGISEFSRTRINCFLSAKKLLIFFLLSPWKLTLWILIRNPLPRCFLCVSTKCVSMKN